MEITGNLMGRPKPVYLDHQATTPVDPRVLEAMLPYFGAKFGNAAAAATASGGKPSRLWTTPANAVAELAGAAAREIVFTSGATESNNLALKGIADFTDQGTHIVTMATEHKCVLDPRRHLERMGFRHLPPAAARTASSTSTSLRAAFQPGHLAWSA